METINDFFAEIVLDNDGSDLTDEELAAFLTMDLLDLA